MSTHLSGSSLFGLDLVTLLFNEDFDREVAVPEGVTLWRKRDFNITVFHQPSTKLMKTLTYLGINGMSRGVLRVLQPPSVAAN